jgi:hypothetical protein
MSYVNYNSLLTPGRPTTELWLQIMDAHKAYMEKRSGHSTPLAPAAEAAPATDRAQHNATTTLIEPQLPSIALSPSSAELRRRALVDARAEEKCREARKLLMSPHRIDGDPDFAARHEKAWQNWYDYMEKKQREKKLARLLLQQQQRQQQQQ